MMAASSHRCVLMSRHTDRAARRNGGVSTYGNITNRPTSSPGRAFSSQCLAFQSFHQRLIHFMSGPQRVDSDFSNRSGSLFFGEPANV